MPIVGIIQRNGSLIIEMFPNVQQVTIKPFITENIEKETLIYTDEYNIYNRLIEWGYHHKTVCHSKGKYARDEDGDGIPNRLDLDDDNDGELDNVDYITDLWVNYDSEDSPRQWINKQNLGFKSGNFSEYFDDNREEFNDDEWGEEETFTTWEDWKSSPYYSDKTNKSNIALAGGGSENYWKQNLRNNPHGIKVRKRKG